MKLDDYLTSEKLTEADFAARIGSSQSHVNRLRHAKVSPSPQMIRKIMLATERKVAFDDWYPDLRRG